MDSFVFLNISKKIDESVFFGFVFFFGFIFPYVFFLDTLNATVCTSFSDLKDIVLKNNLCLPRAGCLLSHLYTYGWWKKNKKRKHIIQPPQISKTNIKPLRIVVVVAVVVMAAMLCSGETVGVLGYGLRATRVGREKEEEEEETKLKKKGKVGRNVSLYRWREFVYTTVECNIVDHFLQFKNISPFFKLIT